jgi:anti-anti-sigma factor
MPKPLSVEAASSGRAPVIRLRGDLTYGQNLSAVHDAVFQLKDQGHERLIVDLSGVQSIDSSGISALLDIKQTLSGTDTKVILLRPSGRVRGALTMMRVASLFQIVENDDGSA